MRSDLKARMSSALHTDTDVGDTGVCFWQRGQRTTSDAARVSRNSFREVGVTVVQDSQPTSKG